MSARLQFIVTVPLVKAEIGRLAVSRGVPREAVVAQASDELAAELRERWGRHHLVADGVQVERSGDS